MANLNETHPELFYTSPRPGGLLNIEVPNHLIEKPKMYKSRKDSIKSIISTRSTKSTKSTKFAPVISKKSSRFPQDTVFTSTPNRTTRDYRIHAALDTTPWILFDDTQTINPLQDTIDILAITISTIMLLAAGYKDIPYNHIRWTKSYLENVKDEHGNNPPNVTAILNHLSMLHSDIQSYNVPDEYDDIDEEELAELLKLQTDILRLQVI